MSADDLAPGRRRLEELLATVLAVEGHRSNPLAFDIAEALRTLDEWFPRWRAIRDLCRDSRALNGVSRVLQLQESRLRYEASLFHADPGFLEEKLRQLPEGDLAQVFLDAFHPLVELEQMVPESFAAARQYYESLEPWAERRRERVTTPAPPAEAVRLEDLYAQGLLERQGFEGGLLRLLGELQQRGALDYHDFIRGRDYKETVQRAYGVAFLVTYGYADLAPRDGGLDLSPKGEKETPLGGQSMPISLIPSV